MKSKKYFFLPVTVFSIMLAGCNKDDQSYTTSLNIRAIDVEGNSIPGATVKLYKSSTDLEQKKNQVGSTQATDTTGEVTFNNLEATKYFWFAEKGCKNNINGITTADTLILNKNKVVTSTLIETGSLELINLSYSQYQVFVDGSLLLISEAQDTCNYLYVPAKTYSIRVSQVGGAISRIYTDAITCGDKLSVKFP
jgi:hypothetical protein